MAKKRIDCADDCGNFEWCDEEMKAKCLAGERIRFTMPRSPRDTRVCGWFRVDCKSFKPSTIK